MIAGIGLKAYGLGFTSSLLSMAEIILDNLNVRASGMLCRKMVEQQGDIVVLCVLTYALNILHG